MIPDVPYSNITIGKESIPDWQDLDDNRDVGIRDIRDHIKVDKESQKIFSWIELIIMENLPFAFGEKELPRKCRAYNICYDISNSLALQNFYFCEKLNKIAHIDITAIMLDYSPIDLILGRSTIKFHLFFEQLPSQLQLQIIDSASQRLAGLVLGYCTWHILYLHGYTETQTMMP